MITQTQAAHYVHNLSETGKAQALMQLLLYPESREIVIKAVEEMDKFYRFPIKE